MRLKKNLCFAIKKNVIVSNFTEDTVTMTGKSFSRFMNIQNRKFSAITCNECSFTEFYKGESKGWESVIDFLGN